MNPDIALMQGNVVRDIVNQIKQRLHQKDMNTEVLVKAILIHESDYEVAGKSEVGTLYMLLYIAQRMQCEIGLTIKAPTDDANCLQYPDMGVIFVDGNQHDIESGMHHDFYESAEHDYEDFYIFDNPATVKTVGEEVAEIVLNQMFEFCM